LSVSLLNKNIKVNNIEQYNNCSEDEWPANSSQVGAENPRRLELSKSYVPHWPSMTEDDLIQLCFSYHRDIVADRARYESQFCGPEATYYNCDYRVGGPSLLSVQVLAECKAFLNLAAQLELYMFMRMTQSRLHDVRMLLDTVDANSDYVSEAPTACKDDLATLTSAYERNAETLYQVYQCSSLVAKEFANIASITTTTTTATSTSTTTTSTTSSTTADILVSGTVVSGISLLVLTAWLIQVSGACF